MSVVILGCGPSALFAGQAAELAGEKVLFLSKKRKSEMFGAQYLHRPIPGLSADEPFRVRYESRGRLQDYRDKVYGQGSRVTVSPEDLSTDHDGWNIRAAYDAAWQKFLPLIENVVFDNSDSVAAVLAEISSRKNVTFISTIPAPMLCLSDEHGFQAQQVWSVGDAPERGIFSPIQSELNQVVCSGLRDDSWYRKANIMGYHTVEWPKNKRPPIEGVSEVTKPLETNCDCQPDVLRIGRYGRWKKGVLSDSAFYDTYSFLTGEEWKA